MFVGQYNLSKLSGEEGLDSVDADAIPNRTVLVTKVGSGGWDDIILPVITCNQGLEGHFERRQTEMPMALPQCPAYHPSQLPGCQPVLSHLNEHSIHFDTYSYTCCSSFRW
ncbi:hypothetical protein K435DRAFT_36794 [Dendrothele bispora CBS 962.96]|uniref:Uncharacterized protein n=1 Tax=Dendrothele bispora (strain CBS 962.96) TaxID=1314807 RepID=A0A4S8M7Y4_DENBC|nr:hypothetical protein K435DRAFT_36794 [Dendrothele bispora CBS 962.96]